MKFAFLNDASRKQLRAAVLGTRLTSPNEGQTAAGQSHALPVSLKNCLASTASELRYKISAGLRFLGCEGRKRRLQSGRFHLHVVMQQYALYVHVCGQRCENGRVSSTSRLTHNLLLERRWEISAGQGGLGYESKPSLATQHEFDMCENCT